MDVRLLGTGGWLPTDRRETACVLLREGADALVLDAGSGLRRIATEPELLDGVERLTVLLTHFHLDHTVGLVAILAADVPSREVWAPGLLVARTPAEELVHRLLDPPFLASDPAEVTSEILTGVHELDGDTEIGPFRVETRVQPLHAGPTLALRVNEELVYCTDTGYDPDGIEFARGARILLHEAMHAADTTDDPFHSAAGEAARIAKAAEVERLLLVHVHPQLGDDAQLLAHARPHFVATEVARDGLRVG
jgi:ribonuclease BN (tRNA processing enzyme)